MWEELLGKPGVRLMMSPEEEIAFASSFPDPVPIFRGCSVSGKLGLSWTIDPEVALSFALAYDGQSNELFRALNGVGDERQIVAASIAKEKVVAFLHHHDEWEVIAFPGDVTVSESTRIAGRAR